ncbi:hypothetical protein, unknown function [Leishmania tarentolae]|uniref:Uncharacterized protein n=1 Tax=Leishmania tarentolae TaxID=5689 RepID=A0A640KKI1_LEITA|nr:hypothetical protein, unknown function [Leishmania tarentolae]
MGCGSSTASAGDTGPTVPPCPLFYNFMPDTQLIPVSTLPIRGPSGAVRHPQGGCAARVLPFRSLPIVSEEAKMEAKKIIASAKSKKCGEDSAAKEEESRAVTAANALLRNPSLLPSLSSCFLINIAVDERGRLVPLLINDGHAIETIAGCHDTGVGGLGSARRSVPTSPRSSFVKKGFNFSTATSLVLTPTLPGAGDHGGASFTNDAEKSSKGGESGAAENLPVSTLAEPTTTAVNAADRSAGEVPSPYPPSPHQDKGHPDRSSCIKENADDDVQPASSKTSQKLMPTVAIAPVPSCSTGSSRIVRDTNIDGEQGALLATASLHSVLVKDSHFRKSEDSQGAPGASAAAALPNGGASGVDGAGPSRMRRQLSRITLLRVCELTRWFLFNDSTTHEAHVSVLMCYQTHEKKHTSPVKPIDGEEAPMKPSEGTQTVVKLPPGELRVLCRPTPLAESSLSMKEVQLKLQNMSSSSRIYVEVHPVSLERFIAAFPAPTTPEEENQLAALKKNAASVAVVEVFVVLAPGATVLLAEGDVLGYKFDTLLVPFKASESMAVLGRMLTAKMVCRLKQNGEAASKKGYRHTLMFLAKAATLAAGAAPAHGFGPVTACCTGSVVTARPKDTCNNEPKHIDLMPPFPSDTLNTALLYVRQPSTGVEAPTESPTEAPTEAPTESPTEAPTESPTESPTEAPTEAPTNASGNADGAATTTCAASHLSPLSSSFPKPDADETGEADAAGVGGEQRRLSLRRHCVEVANTPSIDNAWASAPAAAAAPSPNGRHSDSHDCSVAEAARAGDVRNVAGTPLIDPQGLAANLYKGRIVLGDNISSEGSQLKSASAEALEISF